MSLSTFSPNKRALIRDAAKKPGKMFKIGGKMDGAKYRTTLGEQKGFGAAHDKKGWEPRI